MLQKTISLLRAVWWVSQDTIDQYLKDRVLRMGAALAYYTIFSLPALLIIVIGLVGFFFGEAAVEGRIYAELHTVLGEEVATQLQLVVKGLGNSSQNGWAAIIGAGFLIFVATGIFYVIQEALNIVFGVEAAPPLRNTGSSIVWQIVNRLLSLGMIALLCAIFIGSILLNSVVGHLSAFITNNQHWLEANLPNFLAEWIPFFTGYLLLFIRIFASLFLLSLFFLSLYKILPAVRLHWRKAWAGAWAAAVLFWLGQELMGLYLSYVGLISAYGAAGSLIVLLLWVYYSSQVVFLGAEFTKSLYRYQNIAIEPKAFSNKLRKSGEPQKNDEPTDTHL